MVLKAAPGCLNHDHAFYLQISNVHNYIFLYSTSFDGIPTNVHQLNACFIYIHSVQA